MGVKWQLQWHIQVSTARCDALHATTRSHILQHAPLLARSHERVGWDMRGREP